VRAVPRLYGFYPGICLTAEEKVVKNLTQGDGHSHSDGQKLHCSSAGVGLEVEGIHVATSMLFFLRPRQPHSPHGSYRLTFIQTQCYTTWSLICVAFI
jgi:hypothetical protein